MTNSDIHNDTRSIGEILNANGFSHRSVDAGSPLHAISVTENGHFVGYMSAGEAVEFLASLPTT